MTRRTWLFSSGAAAQAARAQDPAQSAIDQRNEGYARELESYFQEWLVDDYPGRAAKAWNRSYAGIEVFVKSVEPNRRRYRRMFSPPDLKVTGAALRTPSASVPGTEWLSIPMGSLKAEGLLAFPAGARGPAPLVIAQHGIGSFPERVFGVDDPQKLYHDYGHELVKAGFAVLAPANLRGVEPRNRMERLARLAGTSLPGLELVRMQALLDEAVKDQRVDAARIGMWGISLGGMATMFWMPLEQRIRCGVCCAWFNHRRNKMATPDRRYSCFLDTKEEHAFFHGWLTEFTDSDVMSLICPRPLLVQTGKKDGIAWWPQVIDEFEASKDHYRKLDIGERMEMALHEGGHEIHLESGMPFLKKWLLNA
jgi:dienelactone hydrolase